MAEKQLPIFAIGHSTRPFSEFVRILKAHSIKLLIDIRTIPGSRYNPQFNSEVLSAALRKNKIRYVHMRGLGGLRKPVHDSKNSGWRNASFRGFADYMQTEDFSSALEKLIKFSRKKRVAIMCAEGNPFRCHRSLVADALLARGINVFHISSARSAREHTLTNFAKVKGENVSYPAPAKASRKASFSRKA